MAKFISKSHVAINVVMGNGANVHVAFSELTGGGSVFYTNNNNLAEAMRRHHKYGKLFKEVEMPAPKPEVKAAAVASSPASQPANTQQVQQDPGPRDKEVSFKNNEDAKDYLAERFGISRSKMKTKAAIEEAGKGVGIKVKWV